MASQFDLQLGFDPTTVIQPTAAQLAQMVAAAAPLGNVFFGIYQATPPDVLNNPRFAKYIWLDTSLVVNGVTPPVLKVWNGAAWVAGPIGQGSIINASLKDPRPAGNEVDGGVALSYIKYQLDGHKVIGDAGFVLVIDSAGQFVETQSFSQLVSTNKIDPQYLLRGGAPDRYLLQIIGGVPKFAQFDSSVIGAGSFPEISITAGDNDGDVLTTVVTGGSGQAQWKSPGTSLGTGSVTLDKLGANSALGTAGTAGQIIQIDSHGVTKWTNPQLLHSDSYSLGNLGPLDNAFGPTSLNQSLSALLSCRVHILCTEDDTNSGYVANDIIPESSFYTDSTPTIFWVTLTSTTYIVQYRATAGAVKKIRKKNGISAVELKDGTGTTAKADRFRAYLDIMSN